MPLFRSPFQQPVAGTKTHPAAAAEYKAACAAYEIKVLVSPEAYG